MFRYWHILFDPKYKKVPVRPGRYAPVQPDPAWRRGVTALRDFFTAIPGVWMKATTLLLLAAAGTYLAFRCWPLVFVVLRAACAIMLLR